MDQTELIKPTRSNLSLAPTQVLLVISSLQLVGCHLTVTNSKCRGPGGAVLVIAVDDRDIAKNE